MIEPMDNALLDQAVELLEKANADLQPELLTAALARDLMATYARIERLGAFGVAALARKVDDASEIARVTGTSVGRAKTAVATGKVLSHSDDLSLAFQRGDVSLDQAAEIASAEESAPGAAAGLLAVAQSQPFHVLKEKSRKAKLEAEQHNDLFARQRAARSGRTYSDELGMVHVHLALEPHVGTPIVARAEAEAQRQARAAKARDAAEPFERHLADAYASLLSGSGKGRAKRPELVVLVSHEVATRGWSDVRAGEVCKIPGVGPISPQVGKEIARDAIVNAVIYDGKDLRHFKRWTRNIPVEIAIALELGDPPDFDGVKCVDCGNRFRTEFDHVHPYARGGPTSDPNLDPRCWPCHQAKSERDRRAGRFRPET
jgi:5-methylcytosine-specific restriction endonuclease McrA